MNIWPTDPKNNLPSVTLGLLIVATIVMMVSAGLQMAGKVGETSLVSEFFFGTLAAYVGRRFAFGKGASMEGEQKE